MQPPIYCSSVPGNSSPRPQAAAGGLQENCLLHAHPTEHGHGLRGHCTAMSLSRQSETKGDKRVSQQESNQLWLADGKARKAGDGAGHGFTLRVFCSYTDPYLFR